MTFRVGPVLINLVTLVLGCASPSLAQQKGQWVPGQFGLNAGVIPDPGITYANLALSYSASQLNNASGNKIPQIAGTYSFWVDENIIYFVPHRKFLGGYFMPYISLNWGSGEMVANFVGMDLSASGGGSGFADTYVQPFNVGWHFGKRMDFNTGYGFVAPTGRFTPGASDNVGSGYWGNNITTGTTLYLTKNQGTTANLTTDWESHRQMSGTDITPGQAFTTEWGFGQVLPLNKAMSLLAQVGLVGYDQWQVSHSTGTLSIPGTPGIPEGNIPFYSAHGIGVQANFIVPTKDLSAFFKYYDEYSAAARPEGRTIAFGFSWTWRAPQPATPPGHKLP